MTYIRAQPSEKDALIGQVFKCNCNGNVAEVIQRGWTEGWQRRIVFLDNDEVWGMEEFFLNWKLYNRPPNPAAEAGDVPQS